MTSVSYTPDDTSIEVFLLHTSLLVLVKCFSCTPDDTSSEVFLLHTSC